MSASASAAREGKTKGKNDVNVAARVAARGPSWRPSIPSDAVGNPRNARSDRRATTAAVALTAAVNRLRHNKNDDDNDDDDNDDDDDDDDDGDDDGGVGKTEALMLVQKCPCRTCYRPGGGRECRAMTLNSNRCVLCASKGKMHFTTTACALLQHKLWTSKFYLCSKQRCKNRHGEYRSCFEVLRSEDPKHEFCAVVGGYNDKPSEMCLKCSSAGNEVRLGSDGCLRRDGKLDHD